jgi:hypothetical protein
MAMASSRSAGRSGLVPALCKGSFQRLTSCRAYARPGSISSSTGQCNPSYDTIAAAIGLEKR